MRHSLKTSPLYPRRLFKLSRFPCPEGNQKCGFALNVEQALTQQVTNSYLDTVTFVQQIKLAEEQVKTAQESLQLAKQRYKLGLGSVVEVTQSEVAVTAAQTRLAEAQYDYKIAAVTLAYSAGGRNQLELDSTIR